jgi:hypothetical protein
MSHFYHSIHDFDMNFPYVLAGWEGSTHDVTNLAYSLVTPDGLKIVEGKFYLANARYARRPNILSPVGSTRYHLNEFSFTCRVNKVPIHRGIPNDFSISDTQALESRSRGHLML